MAKKQQCEKCGCEEISTTNDGKALGIRHHCLFCGHMWEAEPAKKESE